MSEVQRDVVGVADLCRRLKRALESASGKDWVQGEVGAVRQVQSGHCYFALKDEREEAMVDCVAYRFHALKVRRHLAEGARVQVFGRATFWAPRGRTQMVIEAVRPAGRGALLEQLLQLKEKLTAEGLFDPATKRPLPTDPACVGVVTSADGAAWHDIRTVALRRGALKLVLCPALVQGEGAWRTIVGAIDKLERYPGMELLIVGRGGGSFEDLLPFSDERVVRRVAACSLPVISAVGHEIDTSLCDLAADVRAATPSEAAELAVRDQSSHGEELGRLVAALRRAQRQRLDEDRHVLAGLRARLTDPRFLIADKQQWLDELRVRLERCLRRRLTSEAARVRALDQRLAGRHPRVTLARSRQQLLQHRARLERIMSQRLLAERHRRSQLETRLTGLSPLRILARGYAIALDGDGRAVRDASQVSEGDRLDVRLHQGSLGVVVDTCTPARVPGK